ncbi:MAG TPA: M56 family metallopeptidase [Candidatus Pullilachnospira intestinigallinarum]|nr:M56 family metallopeptidase [Candidatus Pullilachnospira intestinigallinarum]
MNKLFLYVMGLGIHGCLVMAAALTVVWILKRKNEEMGYPILKAVTFYEYLLGFPVTAWMIADRTRVTVEPLNSEDFQEVISYSSDMEAFLDLGGWKLLGRIFLVWLLVFLVLWAGKRALALGTLRKMKRLSEPDTGTAAALTDRLCREMGVRRSIRVFRSHLAGSPFLAGYFRPVIFLPPDMQHEWELTSVLRHEIRHWKGGDLWWREAVRLLCCLQWFHPAAWIFLREFAYFGEIACDLRCTRNMEKSEKKRYAGLLIDLAEEGGKKDGRLAFGYDSEKRMERRIWCIMKGKEIRKRILAAAVTAVMGMMPVVTYAGMLGGEQAQEAVNNVWETRQTEAVEVSGFPAVYTQEEPMTEADLAGIPSLSVQPRAVTAIDVTIAGNQQKDIRKASLTKGRTMELHLSDAAGTSANFTVKIINASTGETRTASSQYGTLGMGFTAQKTGTYVIRIVNNGSSSIHLTGTIVIN